MEARTMEPRLRWTTFAAPSRFYPLAGRLLPWCWAVAVGFALAALYVGFMVAPTDATQGDAYRIIFIHVPAAWMSMLIYLVLAFWAAVGWIFRVRLASMFARALRAVRARLALFATIERHGAGRHRDIVGKGLPTYGGRRDGARSHVESSCWRETKSRLPPWAMRCKVSRTCSAWTRSWLVIA